MLAIYTRLSSDDDDGNSIHNQRREGISFAKNKKMSYKIYNEGEGVSGVLDMENRPELMKLISGIENQEVNTVWFRNQNRLERNTVTFLKFITLVKKFKIDVFMGDKLMDYDDPNTYLQSSILSLLHEYQINIQSKQTKRSIKDNVREGKAHGMVLYGYKADSGGILVIHKEEALVIEEIFNLSLQGIGTNKIAEILNEKEVPTRYNKIGTGNLKIKNKYFRDEKIIKKSEIRWSGNTIRNIIKNKTYKGVRVFTGIEYECPILIEEHFWDEVNSNLKRNRNNSGKSVQHKYLLKGFITCGKCGRNMYGRTRVSKKDNYYMCSSKRDKNKNCGNRSINIDKLNEIVFRVLDGEMFGKKAAYEFFKNEKPLEIVKQLEKKIDIENVKFNKFKTQEEKLLGVYLEDLINKTEFENKKRLFKGKLKNIQEKIKAYEKSLREIKKTSKWLENISIDYREVDFLKLSFEQQRKFIEMTIERVYVYHDSLNRVYRIGIKYIMNSETVLFYPLDKSHVVLGHSNSCRVLDDVYEHIQNDKNFDFIWPGSLL